MLLSNRCLLARVQPRPARPSKARAAEEKKKKKKIIYGQLLHCPPDKFVGILRNGEDFFCFCCLSDESDKESTVQSAFLTIKGKLFSHLKENIT